MKRTAMLFLSVVITLFSMNVIAANELTNVVVTPDPEVEQQSLTKITLQFMDADSGIDNGVDISGITLTLKGSTTVLYAINPVVDYARLTLEFAWKGDSEPVEITDDGVYTLYVPAGAVVALNDKGSNAEFACDFTVSAKTKTVMSNYELTPAAGIVEELSTVQIKFPDADLDWFHNDLLGAIDLSSITLTSENNEIYTAVKDGKVGLNTVTFSFVKQGTDEKCLLTAAGKYRLHIPAGMFQADFTTIQNEEINEEYTIQSSVTPEIPDDFKDMVSSPADGSTVGQLSTMTVSFPNLVEGLDWPVENIGQITVKTPDNRTFYAFNAQLGSFGNGQYNRLDFNFGEEGAQYVNSAMLFEEEGEYEVTIPENTLKAYGKDVRNGEMKISFTIDPLMNFTYNVTPEEGTVHDSFEDIVFTNGSSLVNLTFKGENKATISLGETVYELIPTQVDDRTVKLSVPEESEAVVGDWKIKVPAVRCVRMGYTVSVIPCIELDSERKLKWTMSLPILLATMSFWGVTVTMF